MKIKVIYHYASDDTDFSSDCYETTVLINGEEIDLPFEEDYPQSHTQAFVAGILVGNPHAKVEEENVADLEV